MELGGDHFTSNCVMEWNGSPLATTFVSDQFLDVQIPASLIVAAGTAQIQVKDTSSGLISSTASFYILSPAAATAGVVQLISIAPDGTAANGDTLVPASISETGRFVAFQSDATNLTPDPVDQYAQIYLRDTCVGADSSCTPSTRLISVTYSGSAPNDPSRYSSVSADGRFVAFDSTATNILPGTDICYTLYSCVYLRDTCIGATSGCQPTTT
ncbi:MAG TPA: hypothetical protein VMV57_02180, partial [Terracidiphilus sp.]|nr:hypothetical protein [Terracidiphilus sp.]